MEADRLVAVEMEVSLDWTERQVSNQGQSRTIFSPW
jgi:hypothetical protein